MRRRIAIGVRYDGARYHGWQRQAPGMDINTVQLQVEQALSRVANHSVISVCAGRTDARVHACAQVVHFDTEADRSDDAWVFGTNANLPNDISVLWAKEMPFAFHARFSAERRHYRYLLYNFPVRPGILRHAVGWHHKCLDEVLMQQGANHLIGEHDFTSFRGAGCQSKSPMRCMHEITVRRQRHMLIIEVKANAFLLHMVRNIVGALIDVGLKRQEPDWMRSVLLAKDRRQASITIAPHGLYLVGVDYPETFDLPVYPLGPFFLPDW